MSSSNQVTKPDIYVTPTYNANLKSAAARRGKAYPYYPHTTLNELLKILADQAPQGTIPMNKYWSIGREGTIEKDFSGRSQHVATYHDIEHAGHYEIIPFASRPLTNDLSAAQRAKYALRLEVEHDGVMCADYYLRRITDDGEPLKLIERVINNGEVTDKEYVPLEPNLRPTKPVLVPDGVNNVSNRFITTSDKIICALDRDEVQEVIDACERIYGHAELAQITEIGLVQGVDKDITVVGHDGVPFSFKEVVGAQISHHCCKANGSLLGDDGFSMTFDIGVTDAMAIG